MNKNLNYGNENYCIPYAFLKQKHFSYFYHEDFFGLKKKNRVDLKIYTDLNTNANCYSPISSNIKYLTQFSPGSPNVFTVINNQDFFKFNGTEKFEELERNR